MLRTIGIFAIFLAVLGGSAGAQMVSDYGVNLTSCTVNDNNGATNGINVVYYNTHPSPATEVDFYVGYRGHHAIMVDHGRFTKGAVINHNLRNDLVGYVWKGSTPNKCYVYRAYLANGRSFGP
jgi:hypothetical protein